VWRGKKLNIPVVLASATPSLETWFHAQEKRYETLSLKERAAKNAKPPLVQILDLKQEQKAGRKNEHGISEHLLNELHKNIEQGRQSIIYINRRGYSPVLHCQACGWLSDCVKCSAHMVLHKITDQKKNLCCHHCGVMKLVPKVCPDCGNTDLSPLGKGTQKIEEFLSEKFPRAKILRIDADTTRKKGSAESLFSEIHEGNADIIVGTQMIAKGHDYKSVSLVGVIDADASLFSQDFRASERLFAQLMQVAGRAGRSEDAGESKVIIQTNYPEAIPYNHLKNDDVDGFFRRSGNRAKWLRERPRSVSSPDLRTVVLRSLPWCKSAQRPTSLVSSRPMNLGPTLPCSAPFALAWSCSRFKEAKATRPSRRG
jgi:primosomal protein N' (replication factor Y)